MRTESSGPGDVPPVAEKDRSTTSPVRDLDTGSVHETVEEGIALALSGGGYRAMLFHLGALWRLNEIGYLPKLERVSSVSGGSITAAVLGMKWDRLEFRGGVGARFEAEIVEPIRRLADRTIDVWGVVLGLLGPGSIADRMTATYRDHLFRDATLQSIPDRPRFVINATNVQSGVLWRFMKPYMRDYRVGEVRNPTVSLAQAVAASAAFPPFLSPVRLPLKDSDFTPGTGEDLQRAPFTRTAVLTDGGVYDNLGLETVWRRLSTILVSDGGGAVPVDEKPKGDWLRHIYRAIGLIHGQVGALRKRTLIASFAQGLRDGAYWSVASNIANYKLPTALPCPVDRTTDLASLPTRLKTVPRDIQERMINWGYAICDAAMRRHVDQAIQPPKDFPYPAAGV